MLGVIRLANCLVYQSGINVEERNDTALTGFVKGTGCIDDYCFICTVYAL